MALVGINQPSRAPQPVERETKSDFDKFMEALQVANQGFGVAVNYAKLGEIRERREQQAQLQPLQMEQIQAGIGKTRAETVEIEGRPAREDARFKEEQRVKKEEREIKTEENVGSDIQTFRKTKEWSKEAAGILASQIIERALSQGSGPGDFIAAVGTIRQIAGDVGPMKESELNYMKGRLGLTEKASGLFERWFQNEALTNTERATLAKAVNDVAQERRRNLDRVEAIGARDIASKYRDFNFEDVQKLMDSSSILNVPPSELGLGAGKQQQLRGTQTQGASSAPANQTGDVEMQNKILNEQFRRFNNKL